jgi:predicted ATPase
MALRKLLGPAAIATVPGRGYHVTLPVEVVGAAAGATAGEGPAPASPRPAAPPRRTNVPARLPPMFGRAEDLATVRDLLAAHALVSVVGAGGIGKTRLAQALAAELAGDFPDGAWMVELASLADPGLVASAVARTIGIALASERAAIEVVASVLAAQRLLLILDNCEHLIDGVVALVEAVRRAAPDVRLLVTSQEPLKAVEEQTYRLGALSTPAEAAPDDGRRYGAVDLFVAAARAADPHFALTKRNVAAVAEICRRLDGIPLALELAAARVPLLGVEGLRARLDERFRVLTGGARTVLRRHQTLRGTLEWSHGLLSAEEQAVFRRLGVFAGSFTLEAVQKVAADETLSDWQALDHLGALVDKSLVVAEGEGVPRYRLLETTRAFALERLGETGETEECLRRHARATLEVIEAIPAQPRPDDPASAIAALAAEVDNVRAALQWLAGSPDDAPLTVALNAAAFRVWNATVLTMEGLGHCLAARASLDASTPPGTAAAFWLALARLGMYSPRIECYEAAQRAADLYRSLGNREKTYSALCTFAAIGSRRGAVADVTAALDEAERLEDPAWSPTLRGTLPFARFMACMMVGEFEAALGWAARQATVYREGGPAASYGEQLAIGNMAAAEVALGNPEAALAHAESALRRLEELDALPASGHVAGTRMSALVSLRRHEEAIAQGRIAVARLRREGDAYWLLEPLALNAARMGRHADAARIAGFLDALYVRLGEVRRLSVARRSWELDAVLSEALDETQRAELFAAGAAMPEEQAFALAFGDAG